MATLWKGSLRIAEISIPVDISSVVDSNAGIHSTLIHRGCGARVVQNRCCGHCNPTEPLPSEEIVKGYKVEDGYVVLEAEDFASIQPDGPKEIDIEGFVKKLNPLYLDKPYFLQPQGTQSLYSLTTLRRAMKNSVALGTMALRGKEYRVAIEVRGKGFILHTLRPANSVRPQPQSVDVKVDSGDVELAGRLINHMSIEPNWETYEDAGEIALQKLIESKASGKSFIRETSPAKSGIENMKSALAASLEKVA